MYTIRKSLSGARTGADEFDSEVYSGGIGEESGEAGAGKSTDSGRETDANTVPGTGGAKYETDSKNVTSADTK